jgi:hypothetical protein
LSFLIFSPTSEELSQYVVQESEVILECLGKDQDIDQKNFHTRRPQT